MRWAKYRAEYSIQRVSRVVVPHANHHSTPGQQSCIPAYSQPRRGGPAGKRAFKGSRRAHKHRPPLPGRHASHSSTQQSPLSPCHQPPPSTATAACIVPVGGACVPAARPTGPPRTCRQPAGPPRRGRWSRSRATWQPTVKGKTGSQGRRRGKGIADNAKRPTRGVRADNNGRAAAAFACGLRARPVPPKLSDVLRNLSDNCRQTHSRFHGRTPAGRSMEDCPTHSRTWCGSWLAHTTD